MTFWYNGRVYFPYMRGKLNELRALRELPEVLRSGMVIPIIEPVKSDFNEIQRTVDKLNSYGVAPIIIGNPTLGDFKNFKNGINDELAKSTLAKWTELQFSIGVLIEEIQPTERILDTYMNSGDREVVLIHRNAMRIPELQQGKKPIYNVFLNELIGSPYANRFADNMVSIHDGFKQRKNADQPEEENFSHLHLTYRRFSAVGYGDFLIVGDEYRDSGGPAYAVAIHITFIDHERDSEMFIYHFVSTDRSDASNPKRKYLQALEKMFNRVDEPGSPIEKTEGIDLFRANHESGAFPGLGVAKKQSMMHHIELNQRFVQARND